MQNNLNIVIDTTEISHKHQWKFAKRHSISVRNLREYGCDYTMYGWSGIIGVERKAYVDYVACLFTGWERFKRSLAKLRKHKYRVIIVEGKIGDYIHKSNIKVPQITWRTTQLALHGFTVLFFNKPDIAAMGCVQFFEHAVEREKKRNE